MKSLLRPVPAWVELTLASFSRIAAVLPASGPAVNTLPRNTLTVAGISCKGVSRLLAVTTISAGSLSSTICLGPIWAAWIACCLAFDRAALRGKAAGIILQLRPLSWIARAGFPFSNLRIASSTEIRPRTARTESRVTFWSEIPIELPVC